MYRIIIRDENDPDSRIISADIVEYIDGIKVSISAERIRME